MQMEPVNPKLERSARTRNRLLTSSDRSALRATTSHYEPVSGSDLSYLMVLSREPALRARLGESFFFFSRYRATSILVEFTAEMIIHG